MGQSCAQGHCSQGQLGGGDDNKETGMEGKTHSEIRESEDRKICMVAFLMYHSLCF
jgi:hypothetical protein